MKAAIVEAKGSTPVLKISQNPVKESEDEVVLKVKASPLSKVSKAKAMGSHYSSEEDYPRTAGMEGIGELPDGQRVYFIDPLRQYGALSEYTLVSKRRIVPVPDTLDTVTAAAIVNPGISSHAALAYRAKLTKEDIVVVNGATGTAGVLAVKMAYALGAAKVIALGRGEQALKASGAAEYLASDTYDFTKEKERQRYIHDVATLIAGATVVLDYLWGDTAVLLLQALATCNHQYPEKLIRYVEIGSVAGDTAALPGNVLRAANILLLGSGIGSVSKKDLFKSVQAVFQLAAERAWRVPTVTFPLTDLEAAWSAPNRPRPVVLL